MSSNAAMSIAVSALNAQSANLSIISTNLANGSTVGYKELESYFQTLVTDPYSSSSLKTGGVTVSSVQYVDLQGLIEDADISTYMAIDGNGFFVVTSTADGSGGTYYTRAGSFSENRDGYLVNKNGYYLQGWPVDSDGNLVDGSASSSSLETINLNSVSGAAEATENIEMVANLPSDAAIGDTFTTSSEIYDSLGNGHTLEYTWEKTGAGAWEVGISTDDAGATLTGSPISITFDGDGNLDSVSSTDIAITGWSSGANDSAISFDFGTIGSTNGLRQFASDDSTPKVSVNSVTQDGLEYGEVAGVSINDDGLVVASYNNGMSRAIYQIPVATFNDPNDLQLVSGNAYLETVESGDSTLNVPGYGGAGSIDGSALEASTVSTSEELTDMIVAQQAYSSASQVISTSQDMFDALMNAV
ncbi:MAG: flagellar hook protein FlgE [Rhodospirillales bacterium]|nr:flagellar hook protein FlgE [Rhodospirillales bacterium]